MKITPKNWREFQHYKDRNPPWIRLHKSLLDNYEFQRLPVASRALAPMLWLLASDSLDGSIDAEPRKLAFRLRMTEAELVDALKPLIDNGFFSSDQDASALLADCAQVAVPETEAETEALQRQRQRQERSPHSQAVACTTPPPPGLDPIAWEAWIAYRKAKKKPIRPESIEAAQKDLAKYGANQQAVVHQSIAAGYQGLFDLKTTAAGRPPPPPRGTRDDEAKRLLFGEQGDVIDA